MQLEIYNGLITERENVFCVRRFEGLPAEILAEFQEELPRWSGQMTAFYKRKGRAEKTAEKLPFFVQPTGQMQGVPMAASEQQIRAQIEREYLEKKRLEEMEEMRAEIERMKQPAGHLAVIVEAVLARFVGVPGATETAAPVLNGTAEDVSELKYFEAVEIITNKLGKETIIQLAGKINSQPHLVDLVKNFVQ